MDEETYREIGLFGLITLLREFSQSSRIADHIWQTPRLRTSFKAAFDRCFDEAAKQVSDDDLRKLSHVYLQRPDNIIQHAGYSVPTFIDLICNASNDVIWLLIVESPSDNSVKRIKERLLAIDYDFVGAGMANELRLLGKGTCSEDYEHLNDQDCNEAQQTAVHSDPIPTLFLPLESEIMNALEGKALPVEQLQAALGGANLYRKPWRNLAEHHVLSYMKSQGWIASDRKMGGYFRPNALPPGCRPKTLP